MERSFNLSVEGVDWELEEELEGLDWDEEVVGFDEEFVVFNFESVERLGRFSAHFSSMHFR